MKRLIAVLTLMTAAACSGGGDTTTVFRFTAIPDQNTTELERKFTPVAAYLADALGENVEYVPSRDYQASVDMFKNGDVHLAWFGGLTGVQARNAVAGARAVAQGEVDPKFYSFFIANAATGLSRSDEFPAAIAGLKFTFGAPDSTSGRLMPALFIRNATGKAPEEFFTTPTAFSKSHDQTAELVESGQFQAGVLNYAVYERRVKEGKTDPEVCRVIWQTPTYADYNFTVHPAVETIFGAGFTDRVQNALLTMSDPELLAAVGRKKLIKASNEDFEGIREVAIQLDMLR